MPFIRYATKRAARRAQRTWLLGAAKFAVLSRILAPVPEAEYGVIASDVIAISMGYLAVEAAAAAEDPPRADFGTSTRARRRRLPTGALGESELERQTANFAEHAGFSAAYLAAFVRAVERSQAAEEVDALEAVALRLDEADAYAKRAAASIWETSEHESPLANTLERDTRMREAAREQFRGPNREELLATPFWEKLGPRVSRLFAESRVEPMTLLPDWDRSWPDDPVRSSAATLRMAAESSTALASELVVWGPTPERSETPPLEHID